MTYQLGIDLGTTYTAAATSRSSELGPASADVVSLGARSATVASVLYLADDGSILVGEAAERRALTDPDRVVREFKRRIGDEIPLMIASRPHQAHELAARLVRWVVDQVGEREGGPPRRIAVTHPASWGAHKKDLLGRALRDVGLTVTFLAEPQAAAVSYASAERVEPGSTIAVYDLGGGTFDAAVVRKTGTGTFELLGQPEGIERLGGVDFDEVVFGHVREGLGDAGHSLDALDPDDPDVLSAVARLRRECVEAKEALSSDTEATIPVLLPELRTQSRLVRAEFETMIRPALEETVEALRRAVGSAGLTPSDLSAVLLVGGSSRIPLVSQLVSDELGRPVAVDADPKMAIALGAALAISPQPVGPRSAPPARHGGAGSAGRGAAGGVAAGAAGAAAGAAFAAGPDARAGGPGAAGSGGESRPPARPEPPARPGVEPAAFANQQPPARPAMDYQADYAGGPDYYVEPDRRRPAGLLIGGVIAIVAILAAVLLWPKGPTANSGGTGNSTGLTPETTAPAAPNNGNQNNGGAKPGVGQQNKAPAKPPAPVPAPPPAPAPAPAPSKAPSKAPTEPSSRNPPPPSSPPSQSSPADLDKPSPSSAPADLDKPGGSTGGGSPSSPMPGGNANGPTRGNSNPDSTSPGGSTAPGGGGEPLDQGSSDTIDRPVSRPATSASPQANSF